MSKFILDDRGDRLSPEFRKAFEEFIPKWLESLRPYYEEAKATGVDYLYLANYKTMGAKCQLYEKNGVGYYLSEYRGIKELAFNSDHHYIKCNWLECFEEAYPGIDNISNFSVYNLPLTRLWNKKQEYSEWAERINKCFQEIMGDTNVEFSISSTSAIFFNEKAKYFIDRYRPYR